MRDMSLPEETTGLVAGRLEGMSVPDLMWLLCRRRVTGVLHLVRPAVAKKVYFQDGRIIFAVSSDPNERLGEMLLRDGLVGLEELEGAVANLHLGKRLGTLLVEMGHLRPDDLVRGVVSQVRGIVLELFTWEEGAYRLDEGPLPTQEVITLGMKTGEILLQGIRRIRSFARIRRSVGGPRQRFALSPRSPEVVEGLELNDAERLLLQRLKRGSASIEALCREKAYVLEQTLNEFRLEVQVVAIATGPVITVFELKLAPGIKVSQIASLSNDMARALKAPAVRVVAPLPGKNTIGLEVPNIDKEKVRLHDVIEMSAARSEHLAIPLFLGKDAAGQPLVADLTRMPHLLIAGTTGSGKSVCIGSLVMSILMTRAPSEISMVLVDPKVVELAAYKDVPHLMCPIVTEVSKAEAILDWASTKMDERYALLAEAGVKDIRSYNRLGYDELRTRLQPESEAEMAQIPVRLPYIVIIIDELADLMMSSAKEVEFYLCRIAQKSRAVGIHLIVSTQRPQATVVTGLIKSNLPCRIAFRVSSRLDSRIVLDQNGGEVLMGQGDMLYLPPGSSKLIRAQGTFVDDEELRRVVRHCAAQSPAQYHPELTRLPGAEGGENGARDELFDQAVDMIIETRRGSVSLLQRRLNVGYSRASRLVEQMYAAGIVGEYKGSQAREVLVTKDEWEALKSQRDAEESAEQAELPSE
jgi:S-DNA-T family DNA segregation ATPase FtsK/SpoIIIE